MSDSQGAKIAGSVTAEALPFHAELIVLSHLERPDIRKLSEVMFDTADASLTTSVTNKVYQDFIDLCIPLSPSNVIMYISILQREGNFHPLNRTQIIDRYIHQLLYRPSDVYRDSFNTKNKIDVISSFVYSLFNERKLEFSDQLWADFCRSYVAKTLVDFDHRQLLTELLQSRLILRSREGLQFRYKFFYSYFLGSYVAPRQDVLSDFLTTDAHLLLDDLVEVISGLASDNTLLINDVSNKLREEIRRFRASYGLARLDPFEKVEWSDNVLEEEHLWKPISQQLESGPLAPVELDEVKRSLTAEQRTEDQTIVLRNFDDSERRLVALHLALLASLRNSDNVDGDLKANSIKLAYEGYLLEYQIALIHSPIIAKYPIFVWNGIVFVNNGLLRPGRSLPHEQDGLLVVQIMIQMASAFGDLVINTMATRKLGKVFHKLHSDDELGSFLVYLNFRCILQSKALGWSDIAEKVIQNTGRKSFYLLRMLTGALKQYKEAVNTAGELQSLKRIVAVIRIKRDVSATQPGARLIKGAISQLENKNVFKKSGE